jgi:hypothetical protein
MSVCLYSCLSYPACKLHLFCAVLCCHLWPVRLYHIFSHYPMNGTTSGEKNYWKLNACFDFLYNFCLKHFPF